MLESVGHEAMEGRYPMRVMTSQAMDAQPRPAVEERRGRKARQRGILRAWNGRIILEADHSGGPWPSQVRS